MSGNHCFRPVHHYRHEISYGSSGISCIDRHYHYIGSICKGSAGFRIYQIVCGCHIGVIFTACGFGAGDALMPTLPAHIVSVNFDVSLFCGFTKGFEQLFSNIPNLIMILFSLVFVTFFDTTGT